MGPERLGRQTSILIVDDEFGLAEMMRELLIDEGYNVRLAINGRLALAALHEQPADIVVTDVMMPVLDGPELARAMRADARLRDIPIIFMSSLASTVSARSLRHDGFLEKPFTPEALLAMLADIISRRNGGH
jgi:CheY-like chemotaxis protein